MHHQPHLGCAIAGAALAVLLGLAGTSPAAAATVTLSCGSTGQDTKACQEGVDAWARQTGNTAKVVSAPTSTTERLALYQQYMAAGTSDIDVYEIDVIWPGILASNLEDLTGKIDPTALAQHFPSLVENDTVAGKLVAVPWRTDAGLLYYRSDLLEKYGAKPPQTWQELTATARRIQDAERAAGHRDMQGFVWQGKAYEGLTVDALEWIASSGGGTLVDASGKVTVNNPQAARALDQAAAWVGQISPQGVLNYTEEEARGVFQSGNAVFMRNWPYAWALSQSADSPVKGKVGVAPLPNGGAPGEHSAGVLGGWQLAVSRYSHNKDAAIDLIRYLTSAQEQKRRAIQYSYNPTIAAVYKDPEVLAAVPFYGALYAVFTDAIARPSRITGERYNQVSAYFVSAVHDILSSGGGAAQRLAQLQRQLERLRRGGHW
jgi:trehalose/maltose transport system substrate-binding protein